jgi:aminoglycoside phosphotransferase (APT) family kinase protein
MIPEEKSEAVARGLYDAFGVRTFDAIVPVTGGHTASLVFRVVVGGSSYLLKIITRAEDPTRHYTSMRAAADAGVAPRVWHTNTDERISITDFVVARSLPRVDALAKLPVLLRTLHALPPFGRAPFNTTCTFLLNPGPAFDGFMEKFRAANLLPPPARDEFWAAHAALAAALPPDEAEMASCHNDLFKPDNILFDADRVWLVDWEAAFLNDRYADLAVVANQIVTNDEEEGAFLRAYFGAAPDAYQRARLHLMRQLAHLFYTMAFLYTAGPGEPISWGAPVPGFSEFQQLMWSGGADLSVRDVKIAYARVNWERLGHNMRQSRYREALEIVGNSRARK